MIKILGHWEAGYMAPMMESFHWSFVLRDFSVTDWNMVPVSGIMNNEQLHVELSEWETYDKFFEQETSLTRVFMEPRTSKQPDTTWLHDFEHPEDCVYIFGSAHYNPTIAHKRDQDIVVSIKTNKDSGLFMANQCLALVLYDRNVVKT